MWEQINNYKFHLKDLKFMAWLFPIVGLLYAYEFFSGLMYYQEFRWLKLICMAIMIIGFMDIRKSLKTKIIGRLESPNTLELIFELLYYIFGSCFINHYQENLQICRFFLKIKAAVRLLKVHLITK